MAILRDRLAPFTLGLLGLLSLGVATPDAAGQAAPDLKAFRLEAPNPAGAKQSRMNDLKTGKVRVKGPDYAANKQLLQEFANSRVYPVTFETYYSQETKGELKPRAGEQSLDVLLGDLQSYLLVPTPERDLPKLTPDQAEFVVEYGAALDQAFAAVFAKNPPPVIRVNAARLFAEAARTGAPALGKSVQAMLTNTYFKSKPAADKTTKPVETPPEVLLYALRAAENLLAAHDPAARDSQFSTRHSLPDADLVTLVKVLEDLVVKGPPVAGKAAAAAVDTFGQPIALPAAAEDAKEGEAKEADAKPDAPKAAPAAATALTPEQVAVVRYYRRAAIRALAKVRFDTVGSKGGPGGEARPAFTLAKVAVSDATLSLPSTPADAAEAVLGLAGMAPVTAVTALNIDAWQAAIATGMSAYAQPRMASGDDRTIPWKVTSARLDGAFAALKRGTVNSPRLRPVAGPLANLCDIVSADILAPLLKESQVGSDRPSTDRLQEWQRNSAPKDAGRGFYTDSPQMTLSFRAK